MLSVKEQIIGLSQIWSDASYNFAFWDQHKDLDWDKEYEKTLSRVMEHMETVDYYLELSRFISLLNDGHTHVDFPKELCESFLTLPVKIKWIGGKHIITNVAEGVEIPVFCQILTIDGVDFDEYMKEKILPYCWNKKLTSSYQLLYPFAGLADDADKNAYALIPLIEKDREVRLETSGGVFDVKPVSRKVRWSLPVAPDSQEPLTELFDSQGLRVRMTRDKIAVITLPTFMDDAMPEHFYQLAEQLKDCRGFVVDVRNNGGGHSGNADAFSQAFLPGEFQTGMVKHPIHIGAYLAWGRGQDLESWDLSDPQNKKIYDVCTHNLFEEEQETACYPDCPVCFHQPVVILENAGTGSSSENLLINFDSADRATIVGTPSYGTTGNPLIVPLPGGGKARICTRRYIYPNGKEFINMGVHPHVYADLSLEDLQAGRDSVLDRRLETLRGQLRDVGK